MTTPVKISLIIISALVLVAGLLVLMLGPRADDQFAQSVLETSPDPAFEVRVIMPHTGLPLGGILPDALVKKLDATPRELRFNNASQGAQIGSVGHDRLELRADGWDLSVETDAEGRITPGTRLVFQLGLGGRQVKLRCRPANPGIGQLHFSTLRGADKLGGRFFFELATCENAESGKVTNWPPAPITVRGSFGGLAQGGR